MRVPIWMTCFWPGLPRVWAHGDWAALLWAATFAIAFNFAVVVTFVWPEFVTPPMRNALWSGVAAVWAMSTVWYAWRMRFEPVVPRRVADLEPTFVEAQDLFLKGEWHPAEVILRNILKRNSRDVEAHLMLATLMRHTGRFDEAERQLTRLEQLEAAESWRLEIEREHKQIRERADARDQDSSDEVDAIDPVTVAADVGGPTAGASEAA